MKTSISRLTPVLLASSLSLSAIERPAELRDPAAADSPAPAAQPQAVQQDPPAPQAAKEAGPAAEKPAAWLGVGGQPLDPDLSYHLDLEGGVLLKLVAPESPAAQSGLQNRDIITSVDGQAVHSQESLRDEILKHQAGDEITVGIVQKGQNLEKKITLGERPANLLPPRGLPRPGERFGEALPNDLPDALRKEIERKFGDLPRLQPGHGDERFEQLRQRLDKLMQDLPEDAREKNFGMNFNMQSSVRFQDEEGSVELKTTNGGKEIIIRDQEGETVFEGPYDTPQDKEAVPAELRPRLEKLDLEGKGIQMKIK
ncbi:MAG: S1C family serine protease [Verrucomicrobiales bacterium]